MAGPIRMPPVLPLAFHSTRPARPIGISRPRTVTKGDKKARRKTLGKKNESRKERLENERLQLKMVKSSRFLSAESSGNAMGNYVPQWVSTRTNLTRPTALL